MHSRKSWGRVPTIVATLMLKAYSLLTPDQAIDQVRKIVTRHSVQTVKQYNHIHEFDAHRKTEMTASAVSDTRLLNLAKDEAEAEGEGEPGVKGAAPGGADLSKLKGLDSITGQVRKSPP